MAEQFKNKNILIIGANGGIGGEIAKRVLADGGTVYAAGRTRPDLDLEFAAWDATKPDDAAFANLPDLLHGFVYCAGTINLKPFGRFSLEDFESDYKINVLGAVAALQPNINRLKKAKKSGVVFFSTVAA